MSFLDIEKEIVNLGKKVSGISCMGNPNPTLTLYHDDAR